MTMTLISFPIFAHVFKLPRLARFVFAATAASGAATIADAARPGDVARGEAYFRQSCAVCHAAGPGMTGGQGPSLAGVVGRRAASASDFAYTKALVDAGWVWTEDTLDRFLTDPIRAVPGTNMVLAVPDAQDRSDVIAYLKSLPAAPAGLRAERVPGKADAADLNDWRQQRPGVRHFLTVEKLPAPFATESSGNGPSVVAKPEGASLAVPEGFKVELFAQGLNGPRLIHVGPNGDIFVAETRANRVRVLRPSADGTRVEADEIFAADLDRPFGMSFYPAGDQPQWLYVAHNNSVVRFPYRTGELKAGGAAQTIVRKLANSAGGHSTRDVAFSNDGKQLFISVGSGSNVAENLSRKSAEDVRAWETEHGLGAAWGGEFHRADVLVTDPEGKAEVKVFASGIRNPVGLAVNPTTGELWTSTNERDGLGDDLVPDYVTRVKSGGYYGWPWYYLGNHEEPRLAGTRPDLAGKATMPDVLIQAHSAALGIAFYNAKEGAAVFPAEYRGDLFVALHGSWNRASRTGYKVVRVVLRDGKPTGEYDDFLTGFVVSGRAVWGRPVGVAVAKDGALLVSEDGNDTIWRVSAVKK